MSNIAASLARVAQGSPDGVALVCKRSGRWQHWTFAEVESNAAYFAEFLQGQGVGRGDRVMLMVRPSMEFICLTFALFALGAVVILIDPGMGYRNLLSCIGSVRASTLIAIPQAQLFCRLFRQPFRTVRRHICVGSGLGLLGKELPSPAQSVRRLSITSTQADDLAAIIFTTGSTGPPKGVRYEHRIFQAQLQQIQDYYRIGAGDIDQPAFPLFALFSIALGARAVIPEMDPTRPAQVNPQKFIQSINNFQVTYSFGSPAIWNVISRYCQHQGLCLSSLKKVLMAGAPVSGELIERLYSILPPDAEIHIPYGATESLPIVSISGREVLSETWQLTRQGMGACVGRPLPGIDVRVIAVSAGQIASFTPPSGKGLEPGKQWLPAYEVGEIIVRGPVVTAAYDNNDAENRLAKISDGDGFWHRIGDLGYIDDVGRLWFCGRKAHQVTTARRALYTICCEAIFNNHPLVYRSALVGVGRPGRMRPVLIVEPRAKIMNSMKLFAELRQIALEHEHTVEIADFLTYDAFPVDIRHNAKICREKLALWAAKQVQD